MYQVNLGLYHTPTKIMHECQSDRENLSKKRKLEDSQAAAREIFEKHKTNRTSSPFDANLNLETTQPTWEWQRYLDIKVHKLVTKIYYSVYVKTYLNRN